MVLHDNFEWDDDKARKNLKKHGVSAQQVQTALRIAAVVNAVSRVVAGEAAAAQASR